MKIKDSIVLITGASSGLGRECAGQLIRKGAIVYGFARNSDKLEAIRKDLGNLFIPIAGDVRKEKDVQRAVNLALKAHKRIDVLINSAGIGIFGPLEKQSTAAWNSQIDTNLRGVFLCTKAVVPHMKRQNESKGFGGQIVNIASVAGMVGNANFSIYNATKFGVRGFSEASMKELRHDGIKVSCINPGSIQTNFFDETTVQLSPKAMKVKDVAATVLHVLSAPNEYLISEVTMRPLRP